jgi:hypothetical protein
VSAVGRTLRDVSDQLSLFAPAVQGPAIADLQGLLAGPGQAVRRNGTARLSVIVAESWRADALLAEFAARGLDGDTAPDGAALTVRSGACEAEPAITVRTEFSPRLAQLAALWLRGAVKRPPDGFAFDGPSLRGWAIAAGSMTSGGYLLRLAPTDEPAWPAIGSALAAAGLPATFVGVRADGPGFRITSRRRLTRLRELIGEPPANAADWS